MSAGAGRTAVITGGTDGIGAATAMELVRRGADVLVIGRSQAKADGLLAAADRSGGGSLRAHIADFSEMHTVERTVADIAETVSAIDLLVHAVGILISRTEHTSEGIEKDFAVGYLSRFVFTEAAAEAGLLHSASRMINLAASALKVPRYAQMEFDDLAKVEARTGMRSHGQAQLANDLYTAQAGERYGIVAIGYGPGAVNTSIRREVPGVLQAIMKPFFARSTRQPADVARELADLLADPSPTSAGASFHNRNGSFPVSPYIADPARQAALLETSIALRRKALAARSATS